MMIQCRKHKQTGATLVIGLIMLVVLTLIVTSTIMSSNTNLRISGNMQVQEEASAAVQQAIEQVIDINNPVDFSSVQVSRNIRIDNGMMQYGVIVDKPTCLNNTPIYSNDPSLDTSNEDDKLCFGDMDNEGMFDADGKPVLKPTKCNKQQFSLRASVTDNNSGAKVSHDQGVAKRSYKPTTC